MSTPMTGRNDGSDGAWSNGGSVPSEPVDVQQLLNLIVEHASRPLDEAQALPAKYYLSKELHDLEIERIFKRDWLYICRADELERPGDFYSFQIANEPLVMVRGSDGRIYCLSRVCPHRFMDILADEEGARGNTQGFVCPYHSWAFSLEGNLTGAPMMERSRRFERERGSYCMASYPVEEWNGFVFVNLDRNAEALGSRFAELEEMLAPWRLPEWKVADRIDWPESPVNWKVAIDNGRECYHHQGAHRESAEPIWPTAMVEVDTNDSEYFYWERMMCAPDAAVAIEDGHFIQPTVLPPLEGLTPFERSFSYLVGLYPTMWFATGPDVCLVAKWWPTGHLTHKFELTVLVHESRLDHPDVAKAVEESTQWALEIQKEDSKMVTGIQAMLGSDNATKGGAFSHMERPLWQFQRYMANRLAGANLSCPPLSSDEAVSSR